MSSYYYEKLSEVENERIKNLKQVLFSIPLIKYFGLEPFFVKKVSDAKEEEVKVEEAQTFFESFSSAIWYSSSNFLVVITFSFYILFGQDIKTSYAISVVHLLMTLSQKVIDISLFIETYSSAIISGEEIKNYLLLPEVSLLKDSSCKKGTIKVGKIQIYDILKDLNIDFAPNKLTTIKGKVGCGKTSLLLSILGEMGANGNIQMNGTISYCSQLPWIESNSLRDIICFGSPYIKEKFEKILSICQLADEVSQLPGKDQCIIGEKGLNLSGGQKARVCLARAVYSDADIYLFDDIFSALDVKVGQLIFQQLFLQYLKGKTVILVTHQKFCFSHSDEIISIEDGKIQKSDLDKIEQEDEEEEIENDSEEIDEKDEEEEVEEDEDEEQVERVSIFEFLKTFMFSSGFLLPLSIIIFNFLYTFIQKYSSWVAIEWAKDSKYVHHSSFYYISLFIFIFILNAGFNTLKRYSVMKLSTSITKLIHEKLINGVIYSPMSFFESEPTGRIMSRYTTDLGAIDAMIWQISLTTHQLIEIVTTLFIIIYFSPIFSILMIPFVYFLYKYFSKLRKSGKGLHRMSIKNDATFESFSNSSIEGSEVIRAFEKGDHYMNRFFDVMRDKIGIEAVIDIMFDWTTIHVSYLSQMLLFFSLFSLFYNWDSVDTQMVGLIISIVIDCNHYIHILMINSGELEEYYHRIERLYKYIHLPCEGKPSDVLPSSQWPKNGEIILKNVSFKYPSSNNMLFENLNLSFLPGEKIGVCGRTGSGKSSLLKLLLRIVEPTNGEIIIDDLKINNLNIQKLRERVSVIQQDPILFNGTIRENLDPLNLSSDEEIWEKLKLIKMEEFVQSKKEKLNFVIENGGENLSAGQRQLFCLGRAILKKTKILFLDEATSLIDVETDHFIQETIHSVFKKCTIITIAHRINTVLNSDRILIFDQGKVVEFDETKKLLENPKSLFYQMNQKGSEKDLELDY